MCSVDVSEHELVALYTTHLNITHFHDLLLIGVLRFSFAVVEGGFGLPPLVFDLLTSSIVSAFSLLQFSVRKVPLSLELCSILGMAFPKFFISSSMVFSADQQSVG